MTLPSALCGVLPGPGVGALGDLGDLAVGALLGVHELDVALVALGLLVHEVEHTLRAGGGGDDEVDLHADLGDGLGEALVQADKVMTVPTVTPASPFMPSTAPMMATSA